MFLKMFQCFILHVTTSENVFKMFYTKMFVKCCKIFAKKCRKFFRRGYV